MPAGAGRVPQPATSRPPGVATSPRATPVTKAGLVPIEENRELLRELRRVLNGSNGGPSVTTSLLKTFQNDPNLGHVRHWKQDWTEADHGEAAVVLPARHPVTAGANGSNGSDGH